MRVILAYACLFLVETIQEPMSPIFTLMTAQDADEKADMARPLLNVPRPTLPGPDFRGTAATLFAHFHMSGYLSAICNRLTSMTRELNVNGNAEPVFFDEP